MLTSIDIENFRCIETATLELNPEGTGILGRNASGKTSLLEAIYFLGHGRSLRTNLREKLVCTGRDYFRIVGRVDVPRGQLVVGAEYSAGATQMRLAGQNVSSVSEIAEALPIQLIDPAVHRLVEEGSARRRRLLDWGVFHVKQEFLPVWRRYQRALVQRNAALRGQLETEVVTAWERELDEYGVAVDRARQDYAERLRFYFERIAAGLLQCRASFQYRRGWPEDQELSQALRDRRVRDQRVRTTTCGPHRADITFTLDGVLARDRVSRGQQKMLACALILAQVEMRALSASVPTCLLLDDPAAELDVDNLGKLLAAIASVPAQLVVTAVSEAGLEGMNVKQRFHVEQGRFAPMLYSRAAKTGLNHD